MDLCAFVFHRQVAALAGHLIAREDELAHQLVRTGQATTTRGAHGHSDGPQLTAHPGAVQAVLGADLYRGHARAVVDLHRRSAFTTLRPAAFGALRLLHRLLGPVRVVPAGLASVSLVMLGGGERFEV